MEFDPDQYSAMTVAVDSDIEADDVESALRRLEDFIQTFARPERRFD